MQYLNNLYNFKNPIRHFFNLGNIKFDNVEELQFSDLCWTVPVKFKVFKTEDTQRTISFPNILNFYHAIKNFESEPNFRSIDRMSGKKRVSPDLSIGEFSAFSYYDSIRKDIFNLTRFDKLLVLDIKSFYGRIYTHDLSYAQDGQRYLEQRVGSLNNGRTNGLLLGSYLSLYLAELILAKIETKLDDELRNHSIECYYEYFSDDFYFFCNNTDIEKITKIFTSVLGEYELDINHDKTTIFDFEEYTRNNNLEKLWKAIINRAKMVDKTPRLPNTKIHTPIFTQLIYRLSQISELKYKRIFLANFFKTHYFFKFKPQNYSLSESDFNYICYIYKLMPEALLYSLYKVKNINGFDMVKFKEFIKTRFKSSLLAQRQEEQVYFYYGMKICGFEDLLLGFKDDVIKSQNQILISYFILDGVIGREDYQNFVVSASESEWLQNYHYLLKYDRSNIEILIPSHANNQRKKDSYHDFYNLNIENNIPIVKPISEVTSSIESYVQSKIDSYREEGQKRGIII